MQDLVYFHLCDQTVSKELQAVQSVARKVNLTFVDM